tara:strand:+ start:68 stop:241 length:174 start_codon:yes stop_codon:yes gene_type:complete
MSEKGRKWDGRSRVSNDLYRKRFDEIFRNKSKDDVKHDHVNKDHANKKAINNEKTRR